MENRDILEQLIDLKIIKILRIFFENDKKQFYLREISQKTGVSAASTFRLLNKLVQLKVIDQLISAKFKTYILADNENTRFLGQLIKKEKQILQILITRVKEILGLEEVILYGKEEKDRAIVLLIGENIPSDQIKAVCSEIREEFNYSINPLVLNRELYEQQDRLGLYPDKKRVLFRK
ncbi:helix-turn-helix domain-containing protein [Candidatus Woesearchaeota archaeon]|nr:helix-turn-helix domain-containing protein [Candidatus Woesearchaeota archaeon]